MTNTTAQIEIINTTFEEQPVQIMVINEQPVIGGGISESEEDNTICGAAIVYEF